MPGPSNSTNRFGGSSYVVGTPANGLGNGVNFTSIQAAINQAVADGYGIGNPTTIQIRAGTYTENITITNGGIFLDGVEEANISGLLATVIIVGSITCTITGLNAFGFSNILVNNSAGVGAAVTITGAAFVSRASLRNCSLIGAPGSYALETNNPSGTFSSVFLNECSLSGNLAGAHINNRCVLGITNSTISGSTDGVLLNATGRVTSNSSTITGVAGAGIFFSAGGNQCTLNYSTVISALAAIDMTAGGSASVFETVITSNDPSGFWIIGTGNLVYCDVVNQGAAIGIDPGLGVITVRDWKPYAQSGAGPAPSLGTVRGTSCFDSSQFIVTDGFVEANFAGLFPWIDQGGSVTVNANEGNFAVAAITLTLPAAPVQGDVCKFKLDNAGPLVIQASGAQVLRFGATVSAAGGTATTTAHGDAVELTYRAASNTWLADAIIGNWNVV